jgi:hypothetical protein
MQHALAVRHQVGEGLGGAKGTQREARQFAGSGIELDVRSHRGDVDRAGRGNRGDDAFENHDATADLSTWTRGIGACVDRIGGGRVAI